MVSAGGGCYDGSLMGYIDAMEFGKLTGMIIAAAIEVHKRLGPGMLEKVYVICLIKELQSRGLVCETEVPVYVYYRGENTGQKLVIDLLVGGQVILEIKALEKNHSLHKAQLLSYLRVAGLTEGLVINFGLESLIEGLQRVVNNYEQPTAE